MLIMLRTMLRPSSKSSLFCISLFSVVFCYWIHASYTSQFLELQHEIQTLRHQALHLHLSNDDPGADKKSTEQVVNRNTVMLNRQASALERFADQVVMLSKISSPEIRVRKLNQL